MPKIGAIVFDLDGVLIDAREWHYEALNRALALFGHQISRYDHLSAFDGLPTRTKLEMLSRERGLPRALHNFVAQLKQHYTLEIIYTRCKPTFAHELALSRLSKAGYKLALASNAVRESVELMMRMSCLDRHFSFMLSNEDVKSPKPDPEIYLMTAERLAVRTDACLVVEDNANGVKAAQAAGANVMVVNGPSEVTFDNIMRRIEAIEAATA